MAVLPLNNHNLRHGGGRQTLKSKRTHIIAQSLLIQSNWCIYLTDYFGIEMLKGKCHQQMSDCFGEKIISRLSGKASAAGILEVSTCAHCVLIHSRLRHWPLCLNN